MPAVADNHYYFMDHFKKAMRIAAFVLMMLITAAGAGMTGAFLPTNREPYQNKETQIELVEKREDEESEEDEDKK